MWSALTLPFLASLIVAQSTGDIPKCAQPCVQEWTNGNKVAGCKQLEIACVCANSDFLDGVACCLEDACDQAGKDAAVEYAQQICTSAGVDVPDEVVCKKGASSSSASGSESAATETATSTGGGDTETVTDSAATETETDDAATGLSAAGGALGAILAALFAL